MVALVIAEHDNASLKGSTLHTVTAAAQCGGDVHVLVAGSNASGAAAAAAQIAGVSKVIVADAAYFADGLAENIAEQVLALAGSYSHILAPATAYGKNILPRVAAKLDVAQISEITKVDGPDTFERPIYAGNAIATVQSSDKVKVITVRSTGFDAAAASGGSAVTETVAAVADIGKSAFVGRELAKSDRPELTAAAWARAKRSRSSNRWPTSWAPPWAPRAPPSTPATCRTTGRSARPARSSHRRCTSPSASPARYSTWPA